MAQKQTVTYISDLSGKEITDNDAPTVEFSYRGLSYTVDLSAKEAEAFDNTMNKYIAAGNRVKSGRTVKRSTVGPTAAEIRAWAQSNGYKVPDRGRIPADVREAFEAAS
ncbi:Lsr2 family protein [Nocardioides sp. HM23]|uniref:histone-like nucleoid-structuring protein Lsr2 n=1 Tax=Nocardioides bizhenqiangii TaxID=3095076 RepID=UPI002ACA90F2|nr:Lsr2 family protein [Nocardioides sp. HM23]MDZ5623330.1 Lsr2 family protein [Nocardioides sp. HM23]